MGAFTVAAEAGVPVIPVAIRGSRSVFRGDDLFFRRGEVTVTATAPIHPQGSGWSAAVDLRDGVRAQLLARCGEPDAGL
jgi:1-acyl-sn-glycerol-3-phosphate acyltransferase